MTDPRLSSATKNLVRLARADGPSAAARAKMWAGVSGAVGGAAAGGAAAASGAATGGLSAAKMLTIGTLLGGPLTVGLAVTLLHIGALRRVPDPASRTPMVAASFVPQRMSAPSDVFSSTSIATPTPTSTRTALSTRISTQVGSPTGVDRSKPASGAKGAAKKGAAAKAARSQAHDDALAREAAFVAEAHNALVQGDPNGALRAIASARAVASPQLVPEELAVEAQALRALGRTNEADANDATLRLLYPESALAR